MVLSKRRYLAISRDHCPMTGWRMATPSMLHAMRLSTVILIAFNCVPQIRAEPPLKAATGADSPAASKPTDGQHDFDFLFGTWKVQVRRLKNPLHGSREWYETSGTSVVRPIWGGKANIEEIQNDGPNGRMEALMMRLYSPASRQWSLYWANQKNP